uniref:mixed lineage kinase domain-like protein isoform X1 n=1 Tax=Myxine glutinosa TaxID=7769 RepID=UPI00358F415D
MDCLEPFSALLGTVCPAVIALYGIIQNVKRNKRRCESLWKRVKLIDGILQGSNIDSNQEVFKKFDALTKEIMKYIEKFEGHSPLQSMFKTTNAMERFRKFDEEFDFVMCALTLQAVVSPKKSEDDEWIEEQSLKKGQKDFIADAIDGIIEVVPLDKEDDKNKEKLTSHLCEIFWKIDAFGKDNHPINKLKKIHLSCIERKEEVGERDPRKMYQIFKGTFCAFPVLIKRFIGQEFNSNLEQNEKLAMKEAKHLRQFDHPNIIRLYGIIMEKQETGSFCGIVMEYCSKGSLSSLLQSNEELSWKLRVHMAQEGASALFRLHGWSSPFVHKHVRSESFLVNENNSLKLTDFEFARTFTSIQRKPVENKQACLIYLAPENIDINKKCTVHSDIYSFGVVMWELATRKIPFAGKNDEEILEWIRKGLKGEITKDCPEDLKKIINNTKDHKKLQNCEADETSKIIESFKEGEMETMPDDCPKEFQDLVNRAQKKDPFDRPTAKDLVEQLMDLHGNFDD